MKHPTPFAWQPAPAPYSYVMQGDEVIPRSGFLPALLNGPKAFRVIVQFDEDGRLKPATLIADNGRRTITYYPTDKLGELAKTIGSAEQAAQLRRWAATYKAEQAGIAGNA